jgi:hypothetical protein
MSAYDESKHLRGKNPDNTGQYSPKDHAEAEGVTLARNEPTRMPVTVDSLDDLVEFNCPIVSNGDGTISDSPVYFDGSYDLYQVGHDNWRVDASSISGWEAVSDGYTGQYGYNGPVMHNSEILSGALAQKMIDEPGTYVLAEAHYMHDDERAELDEEDGEKPYDAEGWVVLRKKETTAEQEGPRFPDIHVDLLGQDANAAGMIGRTMKALRRGGATADDIAAFMDEATSGDYDNVIQTIGRWADTDI